jgi:hypothetical protein
MRRAAWVSPVHTSDCLVLLIYCCYDDYSAGACYLEGTGVAQNLQEAVKYFKLAADQRNANARYCLGESCVLRVIYLFHLLTFA